MRHEIYSQKINWKNVGEMRDKIEFEWKEIRLRKNKILNIFDTKQNIKGTTEKPKKKKKSFFFKTV